MREISLDDNEIKSITTYDTSGLYTDPNYDHSYDNGLKEIRNLWLKRREGLITSKTTNFLKESKVVILYKKISLKN